MFLARAVAVAVTQEIIRRQRSRFWVVLELVDHFAVDVDAVIQQLFHLPAAGDDQSDDEGDDAEHGGGDGDSHEAASGARSGDASILQV